MTLNNFKSTLISFFNSHAQINSVHYCDDFDFNAERNITYPVANVEYLSSSINNKTLNHSFKVVLADLVNENISQHEDEIFSDTLQVAEDFFTYLQEAEGFSFNKSSSINKFSDDTADRTAGVVFVITLSSIRSQNSCLTPTND